MDPPYIAESCQSEVNLPVIAYGSFLLFPNDGNPFETFITILKIQIHSFDK